MSAVKLRRQCNAIMLSITATAFLAFGGWLFCVVMYGWTVETFVLLFVMLGIINVARLFLNAFRW